MGMQKMNPDRLVKMIGFEHLLEGSIPQKVASRKVILNSFESDLVEKFEDEIAALKKLLKHQQTPTGIEAEAA